jgi:hypothetical protein
MSLELKKVTNDNKEKHVSEINLESTPINLSYFEEMSREEYYNTHCEFCSTTKKKEESCHFCSTKYESDINKNYESDIKKDPTINELRKELYDLKVIKAVKELEDELDIGSNLTIEKKIGLNDSSNNLESIAKDIIKLNNEKKLSIKESKKRALKAIKNYLNLIVKATSPFLKLPCPESLRLHNKYEIITKLNDRQGITFWEDKKPKPWINVENKGINYIKEIAFDTGFQSRDGRTPRDTFRYYTICFVVNGNPKRPKSCFKLWQKQDYNIIKEFFNNRLNEYFNDSSEHFKKVDRVIGPLKEIEKNLILLENVAIECFEKERTRLQK